MRQSTRYAATFAVGFLAAGLLYFLLTARLAQQSAVSIPTLVVTQFEAGGPIVVATQSAVGSLVVVTQVDIPLLHKPSSGIVGSVFLFDGVLPEDLPRMNPPRSLRGLTQPIPISPGDPLPSDWRE
jgi:hypothetical protein